MDSLFVGFVGGGFVCVENEPVLTPEGLYAGFLLGLGTCGESKSYAVFEVRPDGSVEFKRFCKPAEKKALSKIVYHYHAVKNVRTVMTNGDECKLFFAR